MTKHLCWIIGRGASIACKLCWVVPDDIRQLDREIQIEKIQKAITIEMDSTKVNTEPYKDLLSILSNHTAHDWEHCFITTNWDYLLQREILKLPLNCQPQWLFNSWVYHINGTVKKLEDNSNRSPFLLEDDDPKERVQSVEGNTAFKIIISGKMFVVVGMSFECEMDKFLLSSLNRVQDDHQICGSSWLIVNPDLEECKKSAKAIQAAIPGARVKVLNLKFEEWVHKKLPELKREGVLAF